jgi:hypothetical protein
MIIQCRLKNFKVSFITVVPLYNTISRQLRVTVRNDLAKTDFPITVCRVVLQTRNY